MSETKIPTPRTDEYYSTRYDGEPSDALGYFFARKLERELAEAKETIAELKRNQTL